MVQWVWLLRELGSQYPSLYLIYYVYLLSEYQSLGLSPLILPRGTVGVVIEEEETESNERQLVGWNVKYSGWDLFAVLLNRLMTTPGIGVGKYVDTYTMFCPGYLEWWLDSTLHLVLFTQFILNTVSVAYICIIYYCVL